nr:sodium/potassium/calcium exchanger 1-like [Lytechinus pictus]
MESDIIDILQPLLEHQNKVSFSDAYCNCINLPCSNIDLILSGFGSNDRRVSLPHFRNNASMFRHGALQLMLHTLDPLSDSDVVEDKAMQLQVMAKTQQKTGLPQATGNGKSQQPNEQPASRPESARSNQKLTISYHNGYTNGDIIMDEPTQITTVSQACDSPLSVKTGNGITLTPLPPLNGHHQNITDVDQLGTDATHFQMNKPTDHMKGNGNGLCETTIIVNGATNGGTNTDSNVGPIANGVDQQFEKSTEQLTANADVNNVESQESTDQPDMADMEVEEPLDISWPQGWRKRVTYILLAPLVYLLYFTLPDVRRMESRRWYYITFIGSILWIAGFSYLMVWMAKEVGDTIGFEERVGPIHSFINAFPPNLSHFTLNALLLKGIPGASSGADKGWDRWDFILNLVTNLMGKKSHPEENKGSCSSDEVFILKRACFILFF